MSQNEHKHHWGNSTYRYLFERLQDEVTELRLELEKNPDQRASSIINECADVANFAGMIADNAHRSCLQPTPKEKS